MGVKSMIEFKQIIGRGTRLWEEIYFTIHDFVNAHELFNDPEWDGTPAEPEPPSTPNRVLASRTQAGSTENNHCSVVKWQSKENPTHGTNHILGA